MMVFSFLNLEILNLATAIRKYVHRNGILVGASYLEAYTTRIHEIINLYIGKSYGLLSVVNVNQNLSLGIGYFHC